MADGDDVLNEERQINEDYKIWKKILHFSMI